MMIIIIVTIITDYDYQFLSWLWMVDEGINMIIVIIVMDDVCGVDDIGWSMRNDKMTNNLISLSEIITNDKR